MAPNEGEQTVCGETLYAKHMWQGWVLVLELALAGLSHG